MQLIVPSTGTITFKLELKSQSAGLIFSKPLAVRVALNNVSRVLFTNGYPTLLLYTKSNGWTSAAETCAEPYEVLHLATSVLEVHVCHFTQFAVFKKSTTGSSGPAIVSFAAADPDNGDNQYGAGDTLTITFNMATNAPDVRTKADVDNLLAFSRPIGLDYRGKWQSANRVLVITIVTPATSDPGIGVLTATVRSTIVQLTDAAGATSPSTDTSDLLTGSWGSSNTGGKTSDSKGSSLATMVAGSIAGVVVIGIALCVFFTLRKKKRTKANVTSSNTELENVPKSSQCTEGAVGKSSTAQV